MFGISQKQWKSVLASNLDLEDEENQDHQNEGQETNKGEKDRIIASETETLISENEKQKSRDTENVPTKYADGLEPRHDLGVSVSTFLEGAERSDLSDVQRKLLDQIDRDRENILAQPVKVSPHKARERELSKR